MTPTLAAPRCDQYTDALHQRVASKQRLHYVQHLSGPGERQHRKQDRNDASKHHCPPASRKNFGGFRERIVIRHGNALLRKEDATPRGLGRKKSVTKALSISCSVSRGLYLRSRFFELVLKQPPAKHPELLVFVEEPFLNLAIGIAPAPGRDALVRRVAAFAAGRPSRLDSCLGAFMQPPGR